jgi:hypothetical protein
VRATYSGERSTLQVQAKLDAGSALQLAERLQHVRTRTSAVLDVNDAASAKQVATCRSLPASPTLRTAAIQVPLSRYSAAALACQSRHSEVIDASVPHALLHSSAPTHGPALSRALTCRHPLKCWNAGMSSPSLSARVQVMGVTCQPAHAICSSALATQFGRRYAVQEFAGSAPELS